MKKFKAALSAFIAVVITVTVVPAGFAEIKSKAAAKLSFEEYLATELVKFPEKITIPSEYLSKTYETKKDLDNIKKESSALIEKCGAAIQDNPELFFVDKFTPNSVRVSYDYIGYNDGTIGDFTFTYTVSYLGKDGKSANAKAAKSAYADMKKKFDAEVKKALEAVRAAETDVEKALAVHDYLVLNCEYDYNERDRGGNPQAHTAYAALVTQKAVCEGYSYAYKLILNKLGVECSYVSSDKGGHIWNAVKIGGKWYNVDVTSDDPAINNNKLDTIGLVEHKSFLLSDKALKNNKSSLHAANDWKRYGNSAATNTKYDKYFWRSVNSAFVKLEGGWYYSRLVSGQNTRFDIMKYNFATNKSSTVYKNISSAWYVWGTDRYNLGVTPSVAEYNGLIYFNTADGVYSISPNGKNLKKAVSANTKNGYVYGMRMNGRKISYSLKKVREAKDDIKTFNVAAAKTTKITLDKKTVTLSKAGKSATRKATLSPLGTKDYVYWVSSDVSVAKVNEKGKITGVSKGKCVITAYTANGRTATCAVTVK